MEPKKDETPTTPAPDGRTRFDGAVQAIIDATDRFVKAGVAIETAVSLAQFMWAQYLSGDTLEPPTTIDETRPGTKRQLDAVMRLMAVDPALQYRDAWKYAKATMPAGTSPDWPTPEMPLPNPDRGYMARVVKANNEATGRKEMSMQEQLEMALKNAAANSAKWPDGAPAPAQ